MKDIFEEFRRGNTKTAKGSVRFFKSDEDFLKKNKISISQVFNYGLSKIKNMKKEVKNK